MSWLVSIVLAGMMFVSPETNLPLVQTNAAGDIETNKTQVVRFDETERFEQTYRLNANGRIRLSNVNGSITIEAWDRNEVKLVAVKTADTREKLSDIEIKINSRPEALIIETDYDALHRRNNNNNRHINNHTKLEVEYHITVPRTAVLDEIETVNGRVIVSNMTNVTKVSAVNGEVRATNLRGTAELSTVNGTVEADFATLQNSSQISLSTVNGRANLLIPSDAEATIKADSLNGNIITDFGLPVRKGQYVGRNLYGRVGNGSVRISLNSVNGDLVVRRRPDGKTVNSVTNLLGQSETQVDGAERIKSKATVKAPIKVSKPVGVIVPDINVEVDRAMREAQKEISKLKIDAHKDALKELEKVKVDTEVINEKIRQEMSKQREVFAKANRDAWYTGAPAVEKKSENFEVKGIPKITIDAAGKKCPVYVRGWDKPEVQYSLTRFTRSGNSSTSATKVTRSESAVSIKINDEGSAAASAHGRSINNSARMRIEVFVPKKSNLRIHTNGEIRLENVSGEIDLQGEDEAVNVRDSDGKLSIGTADGRIRVIGFRGMLDAKSTDGMMNLEGDFQGFNAKTVDGTIILTLPAGSNAILDANIDEIQSEGLNLIRDDNAKRWRLGKGGESYRFTVTEGKVILRNSVDVKSISQ